MSRGKVAAQCAHAALGGARRADATVIERWAGAGETVVVVAAPHEGLSALRDAASSAGLPHCLVADAGELKWSRHGARPGRGRGAGVHAITGRLRLWAYVALLTGQENAQPSSTTRKMPQPPPASASCFRRRQFGRFRSARTARAPPSTSAKTSWLLPPPTPPRGAAAPVDDPDGKNGGYRRPPSGWSKPYSRRRDEERPRSPSRGTSAARRRRPAGAKQRLPRAAPPGAALWSSEKGGFVTTTSCVVCRVLALCGVEVDLVVFVFSRARRWRLTAPSQ